MAIDDFTNSLTELGDTYQVLTELHRTPNSRTYLARHLELNRDVTITVVRAAGDTAALKRFAADVGRLKTARHAHVIPVIEGRWLGDDTFAVVRARVRGSTLDQLVSAVGPVPLPRIATTLGEVSAALDWARTSGIGNRTVAPDAMIFQQGSGRVLLAMDPAPPGSGAIADICNDTRTLGRLAWAMLAGRPYADASSTPLATLRPDLSPAVVRETEALVNCRGAKRDMAAYIAMLGAAATPSEDQAAPAATSAPVSAPVATTPTSTPAANTTKSSPAASRFTVAEPTPLYAEPVTSTVNPAVVAVKRPWGFNARLATAVAVLAAIAAIAYLFMGGRAHFVADRTASVGQSQAAPGEAAGDIATGAARPDTAVISEPLAPTAGDQSLAGASPPPVSQPDMSAATQMPAPSASAPGNMDTVTPIAPPATRRHEPLRTPPPVTLPSSWVPGAPDAAIDTEAVKRDSGVDAQNDVCGSPAATDQHRCLLNAIDRNDVALDAVYRRLIGALRRQANVSPDDPDPESVIALRRAENQWLDDRDRACRSVGTAPLYARDRAQCFAAQSARRTSDLQQRADALGSGALP
ncbi:MAG TPA: lysozyme inhibitor LprI family protein [Gemmatimonadaceae bacterium]